MKKFALALGLLALSLAPVAAQVSVEVVQDQDQFLPGEAIPVAVRITNRSGQTLHLGEVPDWLTFSVESRDLTSSLKNKDVPVLGPFLLQSSQVATKRVDLAPYFSLNMPGRYILTATVRIKEWDRQVSSHPKSFYIIEGAKLWEQLFGVPVPPGASHALPEVRKYMLLEANYLQGGLRLYLRVTDNTESKTFKVVAVGPLVSVSHPEPLVDRFSILHLLYQDGARSFSYRVFDPNGELLERQTYEYIDTRPRLRTDAAGLVSVYGGVRRVTPEDLPPPPIQAPPLTNASAQAQPPAAPPK